MVAHGVKVARVVGDGVAVGVCAFGVRPGCDCSLREAAQIGAMVWRSVCTLMSFFVWLLMVCSCLDRCDGVAVGVVCLLIA